MNTFENFKNLAREYVGGTDDISLIKNFKNLETQSTTIAYVFCKGYRLFTSKISRFRNLLNDSDLDSTVLEGIVNGFNSYKVDRGTTLFSYITQCVYGAARTEAQRVRKGDYEYLFKSTRFEQVVDGKDSSTELAEISSEIAIASATTDNYDFELIDLIKSLNLTDAQKHYLSIVVSNPSMRDTDIAKMMGVGRSTVAMYNKRIREKVAKLGMC